MFCKKEKKEVAHKGEIPLRLLVAGICVCAVISLGVAVMILSKEGKSEPQTDVSTFKEVSKVEKIDLRNQPKQPIKPTLQGGLLVSPIEEGEALETCVLEGDFWDASANVPVEGVLSWEDPMFIPECSGEFEWKFLPEDSKNYAVTSGKQFVTVLVSDMLVGVDAVNGIEDKASIVKIDLSDCGLKDLDFLSGAANLQYVILDRNELTDIGALANCHKLIFVSLVENAELKDVSPLEGLEYLETVYLDGTAVSEEDRKKITSGSEE